ncbi:MAG: response regulator [Pseudomonadota bacterium]
MMSQASVLIIEDDAVFQGIVKNYLTQLDYDVRCTDSGHEGVRLCQQLTPDIILCDLKLPDISGLQVIEQLLSSHADLPIIVVSASESMSDIREAVRLGAWDYLVKPIESLTVLNEAIQHCLNRYQLEETYLHDRYELDDHIQVLYQDDALVRRLTHELLPTGPMELNGYRFQFNLASDEPSVWLDFRPLLQGKVLVLLASPQNATEQRLIPLLVFKTLLDPLLRQHLSGNDDSIIEPAKLLTHLNDELCHSRIRTAFDVLVGVVDTRSGEWCWGQAGDRIQSEPQTRPDLALGIWQHASYHQSTIVSPHKITGRLPDIADVMIQRDWPQTDEPLYPGKANSY